MSIVNPNMVTSKKAKSERYLKIYRKLHNYFFIDDFVNVKDYQRMVKEFNTQIKTMEASLNTAIATNQASITALSTWANSHFHGNGNNGSPTTPVAGGSGPGPAASPVTASTYVDVVYADPELRIRDTALFTTGPGSGPMSTSLSPQAAASNVESELDLGI